MRPRVFGRGYPIRAHVTFVCALGVVHGRGSFLTIALLHHSGLEHYVYDLKEYYVLLKVNQK